ncbi:MAG: ribosome assembly RNA-binding protein YhbY, partial [Spirochaetota bacterium]
QYLRSLAHHIQPVVQVGKLGMTDALVETVNKALDDHELIKVKFVSSKDEKKDISRDITEKTGAQFIGAIGNVLILYREQPDKDKRLIVIPKKK